MLRLKIPTRVLLGRYSTSLFDIFSKKDIILEVVSRIRELTTPVSEVPLPEGTTPVSLQSATYFDGERLHVWYGVYKDVWDNHNIYYTSAKKPFTSWTTPVLVIPRPPGWAIRDPTSLITKDYVYLFYQAWDSATGIWRSIRIHKVPKTADFADPNSYIYVGEIYSGGGAGEFDEKMAASPAPISIGGMVFCLYEAQNAAGEYALGLLYSSNVENLPYTRLGTLNTFAGTVLRNPITPTQMIVPCNWLSPHSFFIHYYDGARHHCGLAVGDIFANKFELIYPVEPNDGYPQHTNVAVVGVIDGYLYFLIQSFETTSASRLLLYRVDISDLL
jgi:hypothetical protein